MGVSAAGKTRLGKKLAAATGWPFYDADDYHSERNKERMRRGEGLTDAERRPWLASLRTLISEIIEKRDHAILACSALKQSYRDALTPPDAPPGAVRFVYLDVPQDVLEERLEARIKRKKDAFAGPSLLESQLATLEKPVNALWLDGTRKRSKLVQSIRDAFEI